MQDPTILAGLFQTVIGAILGTRLLIVAKRDRELTELVLGFSLLSLVLGNLLWLVLRSLEWSAVSSVVIVTTITSLVAAGAALTTYGTWQIFHQGDERAALLAGAIFALIPFYGFSRILVGLPSGHPDFWRHPLHVAGNVALIAAYLWMGVDSLRHALALRRRRRLGVKSANPLLENRFYLWGLGSVLLVPVFGLLFFEIYLNTAGIDFPALALAAVFGTLCSLAWWLAFLPPRTYSEWIVRRERARATS